MRISCYATYESTERNFTRTDRRVRERTGRESNKQLSQAEISTSLRTKKPLQREHGESRCVTLRSSNRAAKTRAAYPVTLHARRLVYLSARKIIISLVNNVVMLIVGTSGRTTILFILHFAKGPTDFPPISVLGRS